RPPQDSEGKTGEGREPDDGKDDGRDDYGGKGDQEGEDRGEGKQKRDQVQLHEALLLLLVIDDVERVDDRLHSRIGAPERQGEPGDESEAELVIAFCRELRDLLVE